MYNDEKIMFDQYHSGWRLTLTNNKCDISSELLLFYLRSYAGKVADSKKSNKATILPKKSKHYLLKDE